MQPLCGTDYGGMFSELVRVPCAHAMLQPISDSVDAAAWASAADNVLDGYRAVAAHLAAQPGSDVLIVAHGYPSIPLYALQAAIALGASRVDFACNDSEQAALAERLGAHVLRTQFTTPERRYPIVVEAGLLLAGVHYAIAATEPEGICQSLSFFPERTVALPFGAMYTDGIRFSIGRAHSSALLPTVVSLLETGRLRPELITTRVVSWRDAPRALLEPTIKLVVRMDD
jgi:alcohol dehydrogenase